MKTQFQKPTLHLALIAFFLFVPTTLTVGAWASEPTYSFAVEVRGQGAPLILIPGLSCGSDVWQTTAEALEDEYQLHLIHLPGFAGRPAVEPPFLPRLQGEIIAYVRQQKLQRPIVMGHSLGGFLAFSLAATEPDLFGPVIAVDGVPFLPALINAAATEESTRAQAEGMRAMMGALSAEQFAAQNRMALSTMITAAADVERMAKTSQASTPIAVGQAVYEMMTTDLRDDVATIRSPVLLIAAAAHAGTEEARDGVRRAYESQVASIPNHRVALATDARHFVMLDDFDFLLAEVRGFLAEGQR